MGKQNRIAAGVCLLITAMAVLFLSEVKTVQAASASVSIESDMEEVTVGEEITISIHIKADAKIGYVEAYLDYDDSVLEYLTGDEGIAGGNGVIKLYASLSDAKKSKQYAMTFRGKKKGSCILSFSEDPSVFEADTEDAMSVSYEDLSLQVKKAIVLSKNTKLISLRVSPGEMEPSFSKTLREYKVYVGADVDRIMVSAEPEEEAAVVTVSGDQGLVTGENLVTVTVTAPSGRKRRYKIYVQKSGVEEEQPEEQPKEPPKKEPEEESETFKIREKNGKITLKNKTSYTLVDLEDSALIPSGYVRTKLILYGISVTAYTLENDLENDFILLYAKTKGNEPTFYQYDRDEKTIQRFSGNLDSSEVTKIVVGDKTADMTTDDYNARVEKLSRIVGICAALAVLFALGMLSFAIRYFSSKAGRQDEIMR